LAVAGNRQGPTTFVELRNDQGTLAQRLAAGQARTAFDPTLPEAAAITTGRLRIVGSRQLAPPGDGDAMAIRDLAVHSSFVIVDIGTDRSPSAWRAIELADRVVVTTTPTMEGVDSADFSLAWVKEACPSLASEPIFAVVCRHRPPRRVLVRLRATLHSAVSPVVLVPHDPHLRSVEAVTSWNLHRTTRHAYLRLAGFVASGDQ
jgi:hypothetical protein